jgi:hypothetical protein
VPIVRGSTGRKFGEPTIFSAILNATELTFVTCQTISCSAYHLPEDRGIRVYSYNF